MRRPTTNPFRTGAVPAAGNEAANVTNRAVTNNAGAVALTDQGGGCGTNCPNAPTGSARPGPGHGQVTVSSAVRAGETVTVSYTAGTNPIRARRATGRPT